MAYDLNSNGLMGLGVDPQQARMDALSQLMTGLGTGLLGGRNWQQGIGQGLQYAQQGIAQGRQDRISQKLINMRMQEYEDAHAKIQRDLESQQTQLKAQNDWIATQPAEQQPGLRAAQASGSLDTIIGNRFKEPDTNSEFGLWRQQYKQQYGKEPDMAAINQYRQSGSSSVNVNMPPLEGAYQKTLGEEEGKQGAAIITAGQQASSTLDTVGALRQARAALQQSGGDVGKLAPVQAQATALMQSLNLNPEALGLPKDAGPAQMIQALTNKLALGNIGAQSGGLPANNFSEADRQFITQMEAGLGDNPSAYDAKLLMRQKVAERNAQAAQMFQSYPQTQEGYHKFQQDWAAHIKANPLFSPEDQTQLFTTAAALKSGADTQSALQAGAPVGATEVPADLLAKPASQWTPDDIARAQKALGQ